MSEAHTPEIIVSGHLCLDLIPDMPSVPLPALASPGRLFEVGALSISTGGAVSNTGLALHRLGADVQLLATVGDDLLGRVIVAFLKDRNPALTEHIRVQAGRDSSYSVLLSPGGADRIVLHCTGTNDVFSADDIDYAAVGRARVFHLGYPPLLPRLIVDDGRGLATVYQRAKAAGAVTSLDMALPDPNRLSGQVDWRAILARTLPHTDVFIPSIEEILFMLRRADYDAWGLEVIRRLDRAYLHALAGELLAMGAVIAGFKLGTHGLYLRAGDADRLARLNPLNLDATAWADGEWYHPTYAVQVAGTTGAGDSAYAGFLMALLRGRPPADCVRWACAVGACNVEVADATGGIRSWAETEARMAAGWSLSAHRLPGIAVTG